MEEGDVVMDMQWSADLRALDWAPLLELPRGRLRAGRARTSHLVGRYIESMESLCWTGPGDGLEAASIDVQGYLWHPPRHSRAAIPALDFMVRALPQTRLENAREVVRHHMSGILSTVREDLSDQERDQEILSFITTRGDLLLALCSMVPADLVVALADALLGAEVDACGA